MDDEFGMSIFKLLLWQSPLLLAYMAGLILAMFYWQRCPAAAAMTAGAMALLLFVTLASSILPTYLFRSRMDDGFSNDYDGFDRIMTILGIGSSVLHGVGIGLLLAAVFVGRSRRPRPLPVPPEAAPFPSSRPDDPRYRA